MSPANLTEDDERQLLSVALESGGESRFAEVAENLGYFKVPTAGPGLVVDFLTRPFVLESYKTWIKRDPVSNQLTGPRAVLVYGRRSKDPALLFEPSEGNWDNDELPERGKT